MVKGGGSINPLNELIPAVQAACIRHDVMLAYLYGSQARGTPGSLSDVDVAVLFRTDLSSAERFRQQLAVMGEFMDIFGREDVFVADLDDATPLLRFEVYREGRLLYCQDDAIRIRFMTEALRDYEDTRPLRRLQRDYLLQSIANGTFGRKRAVVAEKRTKYGTQ
jgi:predicted nucleotidyltransferase